jgi:hypothetical protein
VSEHLFFVLYGTSASGKTKRWEVRSRSDDSLLAIISWHAPWRRYVVTPQGHTLFDASCLDEIATFIRCRMIDHKAACGACQRRGPGCQ